MRLGPEWIILILVATCPEVFSLDNCSDVIGFDAATLLEGSNPLETKGVKGISYSIGYTVTDAIIATRSLEPPTQGCKLKTAKIINKSGVARAADAAGAQAAVRSTNFNDPANQQCPGMGLCANVWDKDQEDVYPISFLAYVVVPTIASNQECEKMKIVYDFFNWAITDPVAKGVAVTQDYASLPVKFANSVLNNYLNTMKCANDEAGTTFRLAMNEPQPATALTVHGSGSYMMQGLIAGLLNVYSGAGISTITYDGSIGTGAGLCELTVGTLSCWFNQTSKETVACAKWDAKKTVCLAAGPQGTRTSFAGAPSIFEMRSLTVQRQGQRMIPLFAAAIGIVYNLPSVENLILSREATNKIFLGEIAEWDHPLIQATNPGEILPNRRIMRLIRSDNAAATQILVRALASFANTNNQWGTTTYWNQHPLKGLSMPNWPTVNVSYLNLSTSSCVYEHCGRSICSVGKYFDPAQDTCRDCPKGTYMDSTGQQLKCKQCETGYYSETTGSAFCSKCGENGFQNLTGQTTCQFCPVNTRRFFYQRTVQLVDNSTLVETVESSAKSIDDCKCVAGYWLPSAVLNVTKGGEECVKCPSGAVCHGFQNNIQTIPSNLQGYWGDEHNPMVFHECKEVIACSPNYHCKKGHHGRMCEDADLGYFIVGRKWFLKCPENPSTAAALTVFLTLLVLYVWLNIMHLAEASLHESIDISAKFLHMLCFIAEFRLRWHPYLDPVFLVLLIVNVEVDFVGPQCIWPTFHGVGLFYLQLSVPFLITGFSTLHWYIKLVYFNKTGISLDKAIQNPVLNKTCVRDGTIFESDWQTVLINRALICFGFMYQVLTYRAFSSFSCKSYPDGKFLIAMPDIECGSSAHTSMVVTSSFYIAIVILGFPLTMLCVLLKGRAENKLTDPYFIQRYGTLYEQFKVECAWWEVALLFRKLCISMILALVELPMIQGALAIMLIYFSIWMHLSHLPYIELRHNMLETACLFCAMAYIICGMIFYPSLNSSPGCVGTADSLEGDCSATDEIKQGFSLALIMLVILTVGIAIASALWEMYERQHSKSASEFISSNKRTWCTVTESIDPDWIMQKNKSFTRRISSSLTQDILTKSRSWTRSFDRNTRSFDRTDSQADSSTGSVQNFPDMTDEDFKSVQLHLSHMLNGCFLAAWKDWLIELKKRADNIRQKYSPKNSTSVVREQIKVYVELDKVLPKNAIQFKDALSPASNSNLAGLALHLLSIFPGLIDFLLTASDEIRTGLFDFFESFLSFSVQHPQLQNKNDGVGMIDVVVSEYRSVIAHWLITCDQENVLRFQRLVQILKTNTDPGTVSKVPPKGQVVCADLDLKTGFRQCSLGTCEQLRSVHEPRASHDICDLEAGSQSVQAEGTRKAYKSTESSQGSAVPESSKITASFVDLTGFAQASTPRAAYVFSPRLGNSPAPTTMNTVLLPATDTMKCEGSADFQLTTSRVDPLGERKWESCSPRRLQAVMAAAGRGTPRRVNEVTGAVVWEHMLDGRSQSPRPVPSLRLSPLPSPAGTASSEFDRAWQSMNERLRATWRAMSPR